MTASGPKSLPAIGFFTVSEDAEQNLFGGYLVLNVAGRPLEFHCTAPVRPNRAQEILYGPTLKPFLYGEQIGQALLSKSATEPLLVCTDVQPALAVREFTAVPVVWVFNQRDQAPAMVGHELPTEHGGLGRVATFSLGGGQLGVLSRHPRDEQEVIDRWQPYADEFDLLEPFGRIREAIQEAQRSARQAA